MKENKYYQIYYTLGAESKCYCRLDMAFHEQEALNKVVRFLNKCGFPQTKTVTVVEGSLPNK